MNLVAMEWHKYGTEAINQYRKEIYDFFCNSSITYEELNEQLGRQYVRLCRAQTELQKLGLSLAAFEYEISRFSELRQQLDAHLNVQHLAFFQEDSDLYGTPYQKTWMRIKSLTAKEVMEYLQGAEQPLQYNDAEEFVDNIYKVFDINPFELIMCIWYLAMAQPFSDTVFKYAVDIYNLIFRESIDNNPDILAAYLYTRNRMAGEQAVQSVLGKYLNNGQWDAISLQVLASSAMWMQCYNAEENILQYKLSNNFEMLPIEQKRLHALVAGIPESPSVPKLKSKGFMLYLSPLKWEYDEYKSFFERLRQADDQLPYALAIRDQTLNLAVPRATMMPDETAILQRLQQVSGEDYGDVVIVKLEDCVAISDVGQEEFRGYIIKSKECPDIAILARTVKVGRQFSVKLYTLYLPTIIPANEMLQRIQMIKNQLLPTIDAWEKGMKETTLFAVQQALNNNPPNANPAPEDLEKDIIF